jgi:hypothetical protein
MVGLCDSPARSPDILNATSSQVQRRSVVDPQVHAVVATLADWSVVDAIQ